MYSALRGLILWACAAALYGQAQPAQQLRPAGLEPDWDIGAVLQEMSAHAARLLPVLDRVDVKAWIEKGASDTYAAQLQSSKDQARAFADGARDLARDPEKLSVSLELLFRIQGLETMLGSLEEGIRKYQGPALAATLASLAAENGANRDRFQRYIVNLAAEREQQFQVMDHEAQRCRGIPAVKPAASPNSERKK
jgi:hypothetical protein